MMLYRWFIISLLGLGLGHLMVTTMGVTVEIFPGVWVDATVPRAITMMVWVVAVVGGWVLFREERGPDWRWDKPPPEIPVATVCETSNLRWWVQR